jgi:hypothetical protein
MVDNLNKAELKALEENQTRSSKKKQLLLRSLDDAMENGTMAEVKELKERLKEMSPPPETLRSFIQKKKNKKKKDIDRTEEYFDFKEGKKDESYNVMEAAKGGEVKKYAKGGSVRKNKSNMITKRGWGASRKT